MTVACERTITLSGVPLHRRSDPCGRCRCNHCHASSDSQSSQVLRLRGRGRRFRQRWCAAVSAVPSPPQLPLVEECVRSLPRLRCSRAHTNGVSRAAACCSWLPRPGYDDVIFSGLALFNIPGVTTEPEKAPVAHHNYMSSVYHFWRNMAASDSIAVGSRPENEVLLGGQQPFQRRPFQLTGRDYCCEARGVGVCA